MQTAAAPMTLQEAQDRFAREATQGVCDTGRYRMPYYSWGEGPPIIWVHGVADVSRAFLLPIARLTGQFCSIAYDLPSGTGDGARLSRYTHDDLVEDLQALLDHLQLERAYLVGSSFGTTIVLKALHRHARRHPRAILQAGTPYRPLRWFERVGSWLGRRFPVPLRWLPFRKTVKWQLNKAVFRHLPPETWQWCLKCSGEPPIAAYAHQGRWINTVDLRSQLPEIRQPVLLFCGEQDRVIGRAHEEMLLEGLPNAVRLLVPSCGHIPSYSHPDLLAQVVRQFFTPTRS
jgi:3-oxoadipate enol-lactonase